ncbi:hypothetical protein Tco_1036396, partial [Tanacetum coccineum]
SEWKTHALIWRNKAEIETISLDDFTSSTIETDNTANGVSAAHTQVNTVNSTSVYNLSDAVICAFLASQPNSPQLDREDLEQIDPGDLKEIDLHWEMAMLTIKARRFMKRTCRNLDMNGQRISFDGSKVECFNCHKHDYFARECRAPKNQEYKGKEYGRKTILVKNTTKNAFIAQDGIGGYDWSYQADEEHPTNFALMAYTSSGSSSSLDSEVDSCSKSCVKAYATLKEQYDDLSSDYKKSQFNLVSYKAEKERDELKLTLEKFQNLSKSLSNLLESQVCDKSKTGLGYNAVSPEVESSVNEYNMLKIQENEKSRSDKGYHEVPPPYTGNFMPPKPDLMFIDELVESEFMDVVSNESNQKTVDKAVVETNTVKKNSFGPPIIKDWNSDNDRQVEFTPNKTVRPSIEKIKFVKSARETVEKIKTPKQNKHYPRGNERNWNNLMSQRLGSDFKMINKACYVCGSFEHLHYVCDKKVKVSTVSVNDSTARHRAVVSKNMGKGVNAVKALACWVWKAKNNSASTTFKKYSYMDARGRSKYMTGNKCYLTEYEDYDGRFVSFGDGKGRISGKGKIKTGTLDFDDVYFCKELKYNLFSVSQMCDKKNNVLFTDT